MIYYFDQPSVVAQIMTIRHKFWEHILTQSPQRIVETHNQLIDQKVPGDLISLALIQLCERSTWLSLLMESGEVSGQINRPVSNDEAMSTAAAGILGAKLKIESHIRWNGEVGVYTAEGKEALIKIDFDVFDVDPHTSIDSVGFNRFIWAHPLVRSDHSYALVDRLLKDYFIAETQDSYNQLRAYILKADINKDADRILWQARYDDRALLTVYALAAEGHKRVYS